MFNKSTKDKILSNSSRALGYIVSKSTEDSLNGMLELINQNQAYYSTALNGLESLTTFMATSGEISLNTIIQVLVDKMSNSRPKIAWNSCVSLGNIIEETHIRKFEIPSLFSDQCLDSFISILRDRPNFKVKIHVAQTLAKYKFYSEYGTKFFEILLQCLLTMKDLAKQVDDSGYNYIENLYVCLVELFLHLLKLLEDTDDPAEKCEIFLNENHDLIKQVFLTYIKHRLYSPIITSPTTSSADEDIASDKIKNFINSNLELKETFRKIKASFQIMKKYIDESNTIKLPYASYEGFAIIEMTPIEEFGNII